MKPDTYEDFAQWRGTRPAATVGDACREFTGTSLELLLVWFARHDRGTDAALKLAHRLGTRPGALRGTYAWLLDRGVGHVHDKNLDCLACYYSEPPQLRWSPGPGPTVSGFLQVPGSYEP